MFKRRISCGQVVYRAGQSCVQPIVLSSASVVDKVELLKNTPSLPTVSRRLSIAFPGYQNKILSQLTAKLSLVSTRPITTTTCINKFFVIFLTREVA
jgi:hypothetical protein